MNKSNRDKYPTRLIILHSYKQIETVINLIKAAPIDIKKPLEIVIREQVKARKLDQNSLMWAGPLKDIAEQAYLNGRTFTALIWHEYFKQEFLPDLDLLDADLFEVKDHENYKKYDFDPKGNRILVGSTTDLSIRGFAKYLEQIYAYGANLGVQFSASPAEAARYG